MITEDYHALCQAIDTDARLLATVLRLHEQAIKTENRSVTTALQPLIQQISVDMQVHERKLARLANVSDDLSHPDVNNLVIKVTGLPAWDED